MLTVIDKKAFDEMDDVALIWACIEPTIRQIRGKSPAIKMEFSRSLTPGQQALLMFQILWGHASDGAAAFFGSMAYMLEKQGFWAELQKGVKYFGAHAFARLLGRMEYAYHAIEEAGESVRTSTEMNDDINMIDAELEKLLPEAALTVGTYIRSHPDESVQFASAASATSPS